EDGIRDRNVTGVQTCALPISSTGLSAPTSAAFNISAATANKLVFTVQPSNVVAGAAITPAVQVTTQDNLGNTVTSFSGNVTVARSEERRGGKVWRRRVTTYCR